MKNEAIRGAKESPKELSGVSMFEDKLALIGHVQVTLEAKIGTLSMSVEQLFKVANGDLLAMNELLDSPVTLLMNGKAIATGELLAVDEHYGIRILQVE